jgi:predicted nuclease with TOPRIM domain
MNELVLFDELEALENNLSVKLHKLRVKYMDLLAENKKLKNNLDELMADYDSLENENKSKSQITLDDVFNTIFVDPKLF